MHSSNRVHRITAYLAFYGFHSLKRTSMLNSATSTLASNHLSVGHIFIMRIFLLLSDISLVPYLNNSVVIVN